ncbi:MAG: hypothetical protein ACI4UN_08505 [Muribaculaceae bacterium]
MRVMMLLMIVCMAQLCAAKNVSIRAVNEPAADVFRHIVEQTGKNFVYSADLLMGMRVTVEVKDKTLEQTLMIMFDKTDIAWSIKGDNIILKRSPKGKESKPKKVTTPATAAPVYMPGAPIELEEVVVTSSSRLEVPAVASVEIGAKKLTADDVASVPMLMGESDVIKALQMQPGISGGMEGIAEMNVHGGNADENLFMLDNVPLYQVNHLGGLYSAFNVEAVSYIDFFKSSIPAKYDGRLSSYLDVRTKNGSTDRRHGSVSLGLNTGSLNLDGPIGGATTYSVAIRRPWIDVLSVPILALSNASNEDEKTRFSYAFMDLNGKISHHFSNRATGFVSIYFGDDLLKTGSKEKYTTQNYGWIEDDKFDMHWGNIVAQTGMNYRFGPKLTAEFTAAYTRYFSKMKHNAYALDKMADNVEESRIITKIDNNINDWIFRADFDWKQSATNRVRFGAGYTLHSFLPGRSYRNHEVGTTHIESCDSTEAYHANEVNAYVEDEIGIGEKMRMNAGMHISLFSIDRHSYLGFGPRVSMSYRFGAEWAAKAAYARTNQYVHQLSQTYLSLPTDLWVPVTGNFKAQNADKCSVGVYWEGIGRKYSASVEGYWKIMRNLIDYRDEYYLQSPLDRWDSKLCTGKGTSKGVDFMVEKKAGKLRGHVSYSLAWTDRTFAEKNGGKTFPARFDHRHTVNVLLTHDINEQVSLNVAWTGHSGNRFTLQPQVWESPDFDASDEDVAMKTNLNNYQLPFYHRLDLSCKVRNKRGYWNFSLYNAYCNMNTVAIRRGHDKNNRPVFQKVKLLPIIPSISYTWQF